MGWTNDEITSVRSRLERRLIGRGIIYRDTVSSTMNEAAALADAGCAEGTVVVAEEQTEARGRFDRRWVSSPGDNVSFSVVLRPAVSQLSQLNMAASLAIAEAVDGLVGPAPTIKWPNDVRIDGKKLAGILIESAMDGADLRHAVVGIGINVNLDPAAFPEISEVAASLRSATGVLHDRARVLQAALEHIDDRYAQVRGGVSLRDDWSARLDTLGSTVRVTWRDKEMVGRATSVDDHGNLVLTAADGSTQTAVAGEVTLQT